MGLVENFTIREPRLMEDDSPVTLNQRLIRAGVGESHASMLARGLRTPSFDLALDLESKLGVPPAAWRDGPEAVRRALAEADAARAEAGA